jgi:hypothetical protein
MSILNALVGSALLFFGRKVFWLFVAGAGFVAGMSLTSRLFHGPDWLAILIGLSVGILAALLALVMQRFAIGLAGFFIGGYLAFQIVVQTLQLEPGWVYWLAVGTGGMLGLILVNAVVDWALIALSALAGASLLTEAFPLRNGLGLLVFVVLVAFGTAFQARELRKDRHKSK